MANMPESIKSLMEDLSKGNDGSKSKKFPKSAVRLIRTIQDSGCFVANNRLMIAQLQDYINRFEVGICMVRGRRPDLDRFKIRDEDVKYFKLLEEQSQHQTMLPEDMWLATTLYQFVVSAKSICSDFAEGYKEIDTLKSDIKEAHLEHLEMVKLIHKQAVMLSQLTNYVAKREYVVYSTGISQLGIQNPTFDAQELADLGALVNRQRCLVLDYTALKLTVSAVQKCIKDGSDAGKAALETLEDYFNASATPESPLATDHIGAIKKERVTLKSAMENVKQDAHRAERKAACSQLLGLEQLIPNKLSKEMFRSIVLKHYGETDSTARDTHREYFDTTVKLTRDNIEDFAYILSNSEFSTSSVTQELSRLIDGCLPSQTHLLVSVATLETLRKSYMTTAEMILTVKATCEEMTQHSELTKSVGEKLDGMHPPNKEIVDSICRAFPLNAEIIREARSARDMWFLLEVCIGKLKNKLEVLTDEQTQLRKIRTKAKSAEKLSSERELLLQKATEENNDLRAQIAQLTRTYHDESSCASSKALAAVSRQLSDKEKEIEQINQFSNKRESDLKQQIAVLQDQLLSSKKEIEMVKRTSHKVHEQMEAQSMRHADEDSASRDVIHSLRSDIDVMKLDLDAASQKCGAYERKIQRYSDAIKTHVAEYKKLKDARDILRLDKLSLEGRVATLESETQGFRTTGDAMQVERESLEEQIRCLERENMRLSSSTANRVTDHDAGHDTMEIRLDHAQQHHNFEEIQDDATSDLRQILHEKKAAEDKLKFFQALIKGDAQKAQDIQAENQRLQRQLSELEQNRKTILEEMENERAKATRVQDKLGVMMAAFVAASLELP